jgi:hypothetical protein
MICIDPKKTVDILNTEIEILGNRWNSKDPFLPLKKQNIENYQKYVEHSVNFKETGWKCNKKINILFSHFGLLKYEMEALEMPLYASKVFPNADIQTWYYDSRGHFNSSQKSYFHNIRNGNITNPSKNPLSYYDLMITRSSTINRMKTAVPEVLKNCKYKVNIQTNNYLPNFDIGENARLCHTDFYAPAGRKFTDRANEIFSMQGFKKSNIVVMTGTIVSWKGQAEWFEKIDPDVLKDYTVLILGNVSSSNYFNRIVKAAQRKNINVLYSTYLNPMYLCDVLSSSKIKIMNHYMDPPLQPEIGPSRTFGEAIACRNVCLLGQTYNNAKGNLRKTSYFPDAWKDYTIEYNQNKDKNFSEAFEKALAKSRENLDYGKTPSLEEKCDQIFETCLNLSGIR